MFLQRWLKSFLLSIFYLSLVFLSHFLIAMFGVGQSNLCIGNWCIWMYNCIFLNDCHSMCIVCENNAPINRVPSSWSGLRICFQIKVNRKISPFKEKTLFLNFCNDILGSMDTDMDTDMGSDTFEKIRTWTP